MPHRRPEPALVNSGAAIYAGAVAIGAIEWAIPGGTAFSAGPGAVALVMAPLIAVAGRRVPRATLFPLGPLGAALVAWALGGATTPADAAILYSWPVLWVGCFYGTRATALTVGSVGLAHALGLSALPQGTVDRWCVVVISVTVVAAVVRVLAAHNARLVERLRTESRIDPLTGLLNRRGLEERFAVEIARTLREHRPLSVVAIDIDHFKRINDTYGHPAGDGALVWLASVMCEQTRGADVIARVGGEEFVIVLPGADAASAYDFAERLREAVACADAPIRLTISAGVAAAPETPADPLTLTAAADRALYTAKRAGRNRVARCVDPVSG